MVDIQQPARAEVIEDNPPLLSACLIVRDNERSIRPCLESLLPWVDELIVVDTGSVDRTRTICQQLGARLFDWRWRDDFAAARNESLRHARGRWIFWMDSDDTLPEECGRELREIVSQDRPENVLGYVVQVHCPGKDAGSVTIVDHVKLIRNRSDLRFEFRIHEQIVPAIRRAGGDICWTNIHVVHSGADQSESGKRRKLDRDLRLLSLEYAERPDHPFVLFNLGMTHSEAGNLELARTYLRDCIEASMPTESHLRKAYAILAAVQMGSATDTAAKKTCSEGLELFPGDPELLFRRAMVSHRQGQLSQARDDYRQILDQPMDRFFSSRDAGVTGYKARHNLAIVYEEMGSIEEAVGQWSAILFRRPDYAPAHDALRQLSHKSSGSIPAT